jgi:hypothetical protein
VSKDDRKKVTLAEAFDRIDLAAVAAKERANRARWERSKQEQQKRKGR